MLINLPNEIPVLLFVAVITTYNYFYLKRIGLYNFWSLMRIVLFLLGWFGVYFIIPSQFWRGVYLLAGVPLLYLIEQAVGNPGEQLLVNETLLSAFTGFVTLVALSHYYPLSGTLYLLLTFVFTMLLVRTSYELSPQGSRGKWLSAGAIGLIMTEVFWAGSFMPLHYSALGLIVFNVFYCTWTLCYYFLYNHLTAKKAQFHVVLAILFTALIIIITPWRILA
jgi:hypothetical protein